MIASAAGLVLLAIGILGLIWKLDQLDAEDSGRVSSRWLEQQRKDRRSH